MERSSISAVPVQQGKEHVKSPTLPQDLQAGPRTTCQLCSDISLEALTSRKGYLHHRTVAELFQSSASCQCCELFYDILAIGDKTFDPTKPNQVTLCAFVGKNNYMYFGDELLELKHWDPNPSLKKSMYRPGLQISNLEIRIQETCVCGSKWRTLFHLEDLTNCYGCRTSSRKSFIGLFTDNTTSQCTHKLSFGRIVQHPDPKDATSELGKDWIRNCKNNHESCASKSLGASTPARLLKVDGPSLRLCKPDTECCYTALSHRWTRGPTPNWVTTTSNVTSRASGFTVDESIKTIQDAITVTRLLGISYVWIDSLCIVQDSKNDWEHEAQRMASIYANAEVTISADVAENDEQGFLDMRTSNLDYQGFIMVKDLETDKERIPMHFRYLDLYRARKQQSLKNLIESNLENSPLSERGWILQERLLSPRIIHYGEDQIFWECFSSTVSETHYDTDELIATTSPEITSLQEDYGKHMTFLQSPWKKWLHSFKNLSSETMDHDEIYNCWTDVLVEYGKRTLSFPQDRLPAISGLAQVFVTQNNDVYLGGIWQSQLHIDMLWESKDEFRVPNPIFSEYIAPSWSPLSYNGSIIMPISSRLRYNRAIAKRAMFPSALVVQNVEVALKGNDPFGQVSSIRIHIRGFIRPVVNLGPYGSGMKGADTHFNPLYDSDENMVHVGKVTSYDIPEVIQRLFCLRTIDGRKQDEVVLLISCLDESERVFRRVGVARLGHGHFEGTYNDDIHFHEVDIILV